MISGCLRVSWSRLLLYVDPLFSREFTSAELRARELLVGCRREGLSFACQCGKNGFSTDGEPRHLLYQDSVEPQVSDGGCCSRDGRTVTRLKFLWPRILGRVNLGIKMLLRIRTPGGGPSGKGPLVRAVRQKTPDLKKARQTLLDCCNRNIGWIGWICRTMGCLGTVRTLKSRRRVKCILLCGSNQLFQTRETRPKN